MVVPIDFINNFRDMRSVENAFLNGYCYYFAVILEHRFPEGEIFYDCGHFIFGYRGKFYDITGEVIPKGEPIRWAEIEETDPIWYQRIQAYCVDTLHGALTGL